MGAKWIADMGVEQTAGNADILFWLPDNAIIKKIERLQPNDFLFAPE